MAASGIESLSARVPYRLFFLTAPVFASYSWSRSEISHYFKVILRDELHAIDLCELHML